MKDFMGTMELERLRVRERRFADETDATDCKVKAITFGSHLLISSFAPEEVSFVIYRTLGNSTPDARKTSCSSTDVGHRDMVSFVKLAFRTCKYIERCSRAGTQPKCFELAVCAELDAGVGGPAKCNHFQCQYPGRCRVKMLSHWQISSNL